MTEATKQATPDHKRRPRRQSAPTKSRSRAGCLTCKSKHIKCDEKRPSCQKCTDKGLRCGGYWKGFKWSYKHQPNALDDDEQSPPRDNQFDDLPFEHTKDDAVLDNAPDIIIGSADRASSVPRVLPYQRDEDIEELGMLSALDKSSQDSSWVLGANLAFDFMSDSCSETSLVPQLGAEMEPAMSLSNLKIGNPQLPTAAPPPVVALPQPIPRTPRISMGGSDATLTLISSWFDQVCPAWSAFDSDSNLNRKLAGDLWHNSATVFNSLQSMSASFLAARLPQMRPSALNLLRTATVCIQAEARSIRAKAQLDVIPTGLLFSLFCLGTTVCWLDSGRMGLPFLKEAKLLLCRLRQQFVPTRNEDLEQLTFFKKSLLYWEMLLVVVDDMDPTDTLESPSEELMQPQEATGEGIIDMLPHPWTGVSSRTQRLFSQSIGLCRAYRKKLSMPLGSLGDLPAGMQDLEEAQKIEEQLLELEFSPFAALADLNDTGDQRTPWLHLTFVAEAYQLASLLQLYVTFPELVSMRLPRESAFPWNGPVPWDKWIVPLTLRLVKLLEQVPPDSGSRVIQPMLYICASTGLRYEYGANFGTEQTGFSPSDARNIEMGVSFDDSSDILGYIDQIYKSGNGEPASPEAVSRMGLEVANARAFIMKRLDLLESTLQPRPVMVAKELVKAVWAAYDAEPAGFTSVHWFDVMDSQDLRSLFG
ncbi:unnamed protein product [Clonostachys chloroleuca]|uniref:Zn(2)-C6 fungal-type domain-containing protein n=1 Tax=Clonostachys chloroleuca TaxID=1926264 RepID=A0AA35MFX7_9HYPO|nr:unnamed protein product [Clonostachys chloroleuca]